MAGLQPVDRVIDLVGELDTVFSGDQPSTGRVADQVRNPPRTDFWTLQIVGSVGCRGRATQQDEKRCVATAVCRTSRRANAALQIRAYEGASRMTSRWSRSSGRSWLSPLSFDAPTGCSAVHWSSLPIACVSFSSYSHWPFLVCQTSVFNMTSYQSNSQKDTR